MTTLEHDMAQGIPDNVEHDERVRQRREQVDGPSHYGGADSPYETIRVMLEWFGEDETIAFCKLNAVKYLSRAGKKGDAGVDLRKAAWYAKTAALILERGTVRPSS